MDDQLMKPLSGIRVMDFSRVLAGPLCTQMLGDLGAEVIKVEPCDGDESRAWPPQYGDTGTAFLAVNRNKKSLAVDLRKPEGLALVRELASISDVVVESNSTGASDRLGIGFDALRACNPALIYCSISGFGRTGPLQTAKGYDLMLQAFSGILDLTGEPGGAPARSPFSPIDQATGHHAVIGIMGALLRRGRIGQGARIDVSLFETAVHYMSYILQAYWATNQLPRRVGGEHPALVPYQMFQAADKAVLIGIANDNLWTRFCTDFALHGALADPRFRTNAERVRHREATVALVQDVVGSIPADTLLTRLIDIGIPCSPLNTVADLANSEHTAARGMILQYQHPDFGPLNAVAQPIQFDGQPRTAGTPPPALGEHNRVVLDLLGYEPARIDALWSAGVLGGRRDV